MADAVETHGQGVEEKPTDELDSVEGHGALAVSSGVVLPEEGDLIVLEGEQALVRDGDSMRVSRQVLEDLLWPSERGLGVDDPFAGALRGKPSRPVLGLGERFDVTPEGELAGVARLREEGEKPPAEAAAQDAHRKEEVLPARHPAAAVRGGPAKTMNTRRKM